MKRICLTVVGLYISLVSAFAQPKQDSAAYKKRRLTLDEINLVSSYYHQEGSHAAVTGGTGSQKLTDFSTSIDVKMVRSDKHERKHAFTFELGLDHYTSASSDKINPNTISSASSADTRFYPSLSWSVENEKKRTTFGAGLSYSNEYDYRSIGANVSFGKKTRNNNGEFNAKAQVYLDDLTLILPSELRPGGPDDESYGSAARRTYSGAFSWSQVMNQRLQCMVLLDLVYQQGYLGLPFNRVYFKDNSVNIENLPDSRFKVPIGVRLNYFAGDKFIIRTYYRFYHDNWGLVAHTAELEAPVKITPFFSVVPFYRFYSQGAVDYFAEYKQHGLSEKFFTSNFDLSAFTSHFEGAGLRYAPPKGIFHMQHFNMIELRYGHYSRSNDLRADIISLNLKYK